jgi:hypothetical protein
MCLCNAPTYRRIACLALLRSLRGRLRAREHHRNERREQAEAEPLGHTHGLFPQFWLPELGRQPAHIVLSDPRPAIRVSPDKWMLFALI